MEAQTQQQEYISTTPADGTMTLEGPDRETLAMLPPADGPDSQIQQASRKISSFFQQLPEYLSSFFNEYKLPIISFALVLASFVVLKVLLAVVSAINGVPLLAPFFELVGIGYTTWFVFRYLIKSPNREELATKIQTSKEEIIGE